MKIPDVYRDWRIMFGLALMLLGAGHWIVGWQKNQLYGRLLAHEGRTRPDSPRRGFAPRSDGQADQRLRTREAQSLSARGRSACRRLPRTRFHLHPDNPARPAFDRSAVLAAPPRHAVR